MCSFCIRLCGWNRSLCCSALPSYRAPDEVIRTVTGVARLHAYIWVALLWCVVRFVFCCGVLFSVVSLPRSRGCSRLVAFQYSLKGADWTVFSARAGDSCTAGFTAPALPMISAPPLCLESASALPAYLHLHCVLELSNKDYIFSLAIGSRASVP